MDAPIGATPLLTRPEELVLAKELEHARMRYEALLVRDKTARTEVLELAELALRGKIEVERAFRVTKHGGIGREAMMERLTLNIKAIQTILSREGGGTLNESDANQLSVLMAELPLSPTQLHLIGKRYFDRTNKGTEPEIESAFHEWNESRKALSEANLRLLAKIAKGYRGRGLSWSELIQEGQDGLLVAVDKYERRSGFKFGTLATWWILQVLTREVPPSADVMTGSRTIQDSAKAVRRAQESLQHELGRKVTTFEIAERAQKREKVVNAALRPPTRSLDQAWNDGSPRHDLASKDPANGSAVLETAEMKALIEQAFGSLEYRERVVLSLRFGLGCWRKHTLEEVGQLLDVSKERVRQLQKRAQQKLFRLPALKSLRPTND